jgi:hypothetical protein
VREQRRIASVRLLRAQWASAALQRQTLLLLALRDRINSPLQTLAIAAMLKPGGSGAMLDGTQAAIERLVVLGRELNELTHEPLSVGSGTSFDAVAVLSRRS